MSIGDLSGFMADLWGMFNFQLGCSESNDGFNIFVPVVPHKAVAEVSKMENL